MRQRQRTQFGASCQAITHRMASHDVHRRGRAAVSAQRHASAVAHRAAALVAVVMPCERHINAVLEHERLQPAAQQRAPRVRVAPRLGAVDVEEAMRRQDAPPRARRLCLVQVGTQPRQLRRGGVQRVLCADVDEVHRANVDRVPWRVQGGGCGHDEAARVHSHALAARVQARRVPRGTGAGPAAGGGRLLARKRKSDLQPKDRTSSSHGCRARCAPAREPPRVAWRP